MIPQLIALIKTIIKIAGQLKAGDAKIFTDIMSKTAKSLGARLMNETGISQVKKVMGVSERLLNLNPVKYLETFEKQVRNLLPKDLATLNKIINQRQNKLMNTNIVGTPLKLVDIVFVRSSWIDWIAWKPMSSNQMFGTLWIRVKTASLTNPSGIYQFPKPGHPHGYGPHVHRDVFILMSLALGAGTVFWETFYRTWYYAHRGIGYGLTYRKRGNDSGKRYYIKKTNKRYWVPR